MSEPRPGAPGARAPLRRTVSRAAAAALALRVGAAAFGLIAGVVLARALEPAGYGTYSTAIALATAIAVPAALGADLLLMRQAAVAHDRGERDALLALVRSAAIRVTLVSAGLAIVAAAAILLAGEDVGSRREALLVALPMLPFIALGAVAHGTLLGLGRTAAAIAPVFLGRQAAFLLLLGAAILLGGFTYLGAVALQLAATAAASICALVLLRRALARMPSRVAGSGTGPRGWMRIALPMGAGTMFLAVDSQVGLLVLGAHGDLAEAGIYAAAVRCILPFSLLHAAGRAPLGGIVSRLRASGEQVRLQRGVLIATRGVAAASAAVALVLLVVPTTILGVFGAGFSDGATALRILAVAHLINAACAYNHLVLVMGGQERAAMRAALGSLALDTVLCIALVPSLGATGAALAVLVSTIARNVANSVTAHRRLGVQTTVFGPFRGRDRLYRVAP